jgi:hypothetical protein
MRDATHWGVLTIGTGRGNARLTNRTAAARIDGSRAAATISSNTSAAGRTG